MLKVLFFGDIMGKIGRDALANVLPELKKEFDPDLVVANVENLAHGKGVTVRTLRAVAEAGVDFFTSGDHIWSKKEVIEVLKDPVLKKMLLRPANYPKGVPGDGYRVIEVGTKRLLMVNLLGRVFIKIDTDCPFRKMDEILKKHEKERLSGVIVDFHAEATAEKVSLGLYLDGQVSAVLGTHTHVPTSDNRVLSKGTAYITDVGMVGAKDSSLGVDIKNIIENFLTQLPKEHIIPEEGPCVVNGVFIEINPRTGKATKIERIDRETTVP